MTTTTTAALTTAEMSLFILLEIERQRTMYGDKCIVTIDEVFQNIMAATTGWHNSRSGWVMFSNTFRAAMKKVQKSNEVITTSSKFFGSSVTVR